MQIVCWYVTVLNLYDLSVADEPAGGMTFSVGNHSIADELADGMVFIMGEYPIVSAMRAECVMDADMHLYVLLRVVVYFMMLTCNLLLIVYCMPILWSDIVIYQCVWRVLWIM